MTVNPIEQAASLRIGSVEFVSPDEIRIGLDLEAPDGVAANAGVPRSFPRINSYVLISTEVGYIVGQIEWIAVERSPFPKRQGYKDYGLIDLPFPLRKMRVNPLGVLKQSEEKLAFVRGVQVFPSIGEPVLIPTGKQLRAIIESGENKHIKIGTSPLAANAEVRVDPDRLFGRHLAVLGNTGSGKSCSVAGLIQWSLNTASSNLDEGDDGNPNARFIILDPNGEYSNVFLDHGRIFRVGDPNSPLEVPMWFWNSAEWLAFSQASARAQAPLLKRGLRSMRNENFTYDADSEIQIKKFLATILITAQHEKSTGSPWSTFPRAKGFFEIVFVWNSSVAGFKSSLAAGDERLDTLQDTLQQYVDNRSEQYPTYQATVDEVNELIEQIQDTFHEFGGEEGDLLPKDEDTPIQFSGEVFLTFLETLAQETGNLQYVDFLLARIRTLLSDARMREIIGDGIDITLERWLSDYIGTNEAENGNITVIDLSLVPSEIVHLVTSVIARMTFEALQRFRKLNEHSLPTVLVMEEAHTFIKRYREDAENQNSATVCCQIFEKIAREGRKYGLGLVLSSQRPSELSPTVLSQCNSFLLHRISND